MVGVEVASSSTYLAVRRENGFGAFLGLFDGYYLIFLALLGQYGGRKYAGSKSVFREWV